MIYYIYMNDTVYMWNDVDPCDCEHCVSAPPGQRSKPGS